MGCLFGYGFFLSGIYWITISLTFDDSLKCQFDIALPVLEDLKITTVKTVDEVLKVALIKELIPVEWIDAENLNKPKAGEKTTTESAH